MTEPIREPEWIEEETALIYHERQLREHGGGVGARNMTGLQSALDRPRNKFHYGETDIRALAAAYAFGIGMNHPFVDGNKRTAYVACLAFLALNGYELTVEQPERYEQMLALVERRISEDEFAAWLRLNSQAH